jgi:WXG100 family type VII secretion target
MSSEILITPSELTNHSSTIKAQATTATEQFNSMKARLEALSAAFKGNAALAFDERWVEWNEHATGLIDALDSLGTFLDRAAAGGQELDDDLTRALRG